MPKVYFNYNDRTLRLQDKRKVKAFIETIFAKEKKSLCRLDYVFSSDEALLQINRDFLKHDYYTDIITFGLSEGDEGITGEVYISVDRVADNARQFKAGFADEMLRVLFHGALHLCGYKDKTKADVTLMRKKEDFYISYFKRST